MQLNFIRFPRHSLMWSVAALALAPAAAMAAPPDKGPSIPVLICEGIECPEGFGLLGDAPALYAEEAEADLGLVIDPGYCEGESCEEEPPPYCEGDSCEEEPPPYCESESCEEEPYYPDEEPEVYNDSDPPGVSEPVIETAVESLSDGVAECGIYDPRWRIDCLAALHHRLAQTLPSDSDYDELRAELSRTGAELRAIAAANADPGVAPTRLSTEVNGKTRTTSRALRAVAPARQASANAAAEAALDTLTTTLLRSASSASTQRVHFERAVEAVNSAKVLLRSA